MSGARSPGWMSSSVSDQSGDPISCDEDLQAERSFLRENQARRNSMPEEYPSSYDSWQSYDFLELIRGQENSEIDGEDEEGGEEEMEEKEEMEEAGMEEDEMPPLPDQDDDWELARQPQEISPCRSPLSAADDHPLKSSQPASPLPAVLMTTPKKRRATEDPADTPESKRSRLLPTTTRRNYRRPLHPARRRPPTRAHPSIVEDPEELPTPPALPGPQDSLTLEAAKLYAGYYPLKIGRELESVGRRLRLGDYDALAYVESLVRDRSTAARLHRQADETPNFPAKVKQLLLRTNGRYASCRP